MSYYPAPKYSYLFYQVISKIQLTQPDISTLNFDFSSLSGSRTIEGQRVNLHPINIPNEWSDDITLHAPSSFVQEVAP